jgi:hypothetical protein
MEPRKALDDAPPLDLYALATVKSMEIDRELATRCAGCTGPQAADGCQTRRVTRAVGVDWPLCPRAMLRAPTWDGILQTYLAAQISPLAEWPEAYAPYVVDGCAAIRAAVRKADEEKMERSRRDGAGPRPQFSGRRSAGG